MIQNIAVIITALGVLFAGISPVVLHMVKVRSRDRIKKAQEQAKSSQPGQGPRSVDWRRRAELFRLVTGMLGYGFGVLTLMLMIFSKTPLTTGDAAMVMLCLVFCLPSLLEPLRKE
jgi:polyferredoxin